jgi:hypothetical protein
MAAAKTKKKKAAERITALDLPPAEFTPAMAAYFDKCREKLGFVPNVLAAYAHDMAKLEAFAASTTISCWRRPAFPSWSAR